MKKNYYYKITEKTKRNMGGFIVKAQVFSVKQAKFLVLEI